MRKILGAGLVFTALFLVGCQQEGVGISTYNKGDVPILAKATTDGEYSLYPSTGSDPVVSYRLKEGDPLGFKVGTTGHIIAVAGEQENSLTDGNYVWKRRGLNATTAPAK